MWKECSMGVAGLGRSRRVSLSSSALPKRGLAGILLERQGQFMANRVIPTKGLDLLCRQPARISERWLPLTSVFFLCNRGEIPEEGRVRRGGEDAQGREVAHLQTSEDACFSRRGPGYAEGGRPHPQSCARPQNRQARVSHPPPPLLSSLPPGLAGGRDRPCLQEGAEALWRLPGFFSNESRGRHWADFRRIPLWKTL